MKAASSDVFASNTRDGLSGEEFKRLHRALLSAFPTESALALMVRIHLEQNLAAIASGHNLSTTVFELMRYAEAHGKIKRLLAGALAQVPGNPALREIRKELRRRRNPNRKKLASHEATRAGPGPNRRATTRRAGPERED